MDRTAARVILLDDRDRILLFRGIDSTRADATSWWFTPGGGLEPGETMREAALREVFEETGTMLDSVAGPVYEQQIDLVFEGVPLHQREQFFVAHIGQLDVSQVGWTELEKRTMLESRWWTLEMLEATTETVYPAVLAQLFRSQLCR